MDVLMVHLSYPQKVTGIFLLRNGLNPYYLQEIQTRVVSSHHNVSFCYNITVRKIRARPKQSFYAKLASHYLCQISRYINKSVVLALVPDSLNDYN